MFVYPDTQRMTGGRLDLLAAEVATLPSPHLELNESLEITGRLQVDANELQMRYLPRWSDRHWLLGCRKIGGEAQMAVATPCPTDAVMNSADDLLAVLRRSLTRWTFIVLILPACHRTADQNLISTRSMSGCVPAGHKIRHWKLGVLAQPGRGTLGRSTRPASLPTSTPPGGAGIYLVMR